MTEMQLTINFIKSFLINALKDGGKTQTTIHSDSKEGLF